MGRPAGIIGVEHVRGFVVRLTLTDDLVRELDLEPVLEGGVLASLRDPAEFSGVFVDDVAGTIGWPNGIDLDPDVLHGDQQPATGSSPTLVRQYTLRQTG